MKFTIFNFYDPNLEDSINKWLKEGREVKHVISIKNHDTGEGIGIFYQEAKSFTSTIREKVNHRQKGKEMFDTNNAQKTVVSNEIRRQYKCRQNYFSTSLKDL